MIKILRWISAIVVAYIAYFILEFFYGLLFGHWIIQGSYFINYLNIIISFISTYAFIYIAAKLAPSHKRITVVILGVFFIIANLLLLTVQVQQDGKLVVFAVLEGAAIIAAVVIYYSSIKTEELRAEETKVVS